MTETEPEFDANERESWYSLVDYEVEVCPKCGNLRAICSDPDRVWYPQRHTCYAAADLEANYRRWEARHKDAVPINWRLPSDGTTLWVSVDNLTPEDNFI